MAPNSRTKQTTLVLATAGTGLSESLKDRLRAIGELEPLPGHPGRYLLHLVNGPMDPGRALEAVKKRVGDEAQVSLMQRDDHGEPCIPTGQVTVRFKTTPSDEELLAFAEPLGLAVEKRNDFVPSQVSFRPKRDEPGEPAEKLIERIQESSNQVQRAWSENLGMFHRE